MSSPTCWMGGSGNSGPAYALVDAHLGGRIYRVPTKVGTYQSDTDVPPRPWGTSG